MAIKRFGTTKKCTYWVQDETRVGLKTIGGKTLTLKGVKPIGRHQWQFDNYYIYGVVEPPTGRLFWCEFSHLDGDCFEKFLEEVSRHYPEEVHIIQVDNAGAHVNKNIQIPPNVILLFQPSHSPELNPIERLWQELKDFLAWKIFRDLDDTRAPSREFFRVLYSGHHPIFDREERGHKPPNSIRGESKREASTQAPGCATWGLNF